jgi:hypothetical protein
MTFDLRPQNIVVHFDFMDCTRRYLDIHPSELRAWDTDESLECSYPESIVDGVARVTQFN